MDFNKLKDKFLKDNKKLMENLTVIFLIGLILLIGASTFKPRPSNNNEDKELVMAQKENNSEDYAQN